jgi:hypothetical protein
MRLQGTPHSRRQIWNNNIVSSTLEGIMNYQTMMDEFTKITLNRGGEYVERDGWNYDCNA